MVGLHRYPQGVPSWVDIETDDIDTTTRFYGALFDWTFVEEAPSGAGPRYLIAQLGGQDVAGVGRRASPDALTATWSTYIAVDDADETADRITSAGGGVLRGPTDGGPGGRSVIATDPAGVQFRLLQAGRRPGAQRVNEPGAWNFSDLHSAEPSAVAPFYSEVFGWELQDAGFASLVRLPGYGAHLRDTIDPGIYDRQSAIGDDGSFADAVAWMAATGEGERPHWHVSFTVADRDDAADRVERFGGTVLDHADSEWTREATVRDPQGGEFTISQFLA